MRQRSGLRLTSLMDILVVLLLFLLKSFVVDGEAMVPPPGLELPESTSRDPLRVSLVVAINDDAILVGDRQVATVGEALAGESMTIQPLAAELETVWAQLDDIAKHKGKGSAEARLVTIQGDRDIEFRVLQRVMYTLQSRGFEDIAFAVIERS